MFRFTLCFGLAIFLGTVGQSFASDNDQPWVSAQEILEAATHDINASGGIRGVEKDVPDMEKALSTAIPSGTLVEANNGQTIALADGMAEVLIVGVTASKAGKKVNIIATPYPLIGLYLGSYYNEIGKPEDALRVLNAAISVSDAENLGLAEHIPFLTSEKGAALESLKRFDDALAVYKAGLKLAANSDGDEARMFRGVGFSLTELGRLDDAEAAYRKSLLCEPGNAHAENELKYIAKLRAGNSATPGALETALPQADAPADKSACPKE